MLFKKNVNFPFKLGSVKRKTFKVRHKHILEMLKKEATFLKKYGNKEQSEAGGKLGREKILYDAVLDH